jgi:hypothetical protein
VPARAAPRAPAKASDSVEATPAQAVAAIGPVSGAGWNAVAAGPGEAPMPMPGRYRVRPPPSSLLTYTLTRAAAGAAAQPAGAGRIDWRLGENGYSLRVDGVAGALSSSGSIGDAGIAPDSAGETLAGGAEASTRFDQHAGSIAFSGSAGSYPLLQGTQDRASLLMQLAGIGLAEPDQVKDVLEFYVGAGSAAGVVRFQVLGAEELDSALGKLASIHLVQLAQPGQPKLEVWLAPQRRWLPVQLRITEADGSVMTQLVTAISER